MKSLTTDILYTGTINDYLGINSDFNDKLLMQEGELVYNKDNASSKEEKWFEQLGIQKSSDYFTVEFDSAGAEPIDTQSIKMGKKVKQPANPTKTGHEFLGWYYLEEGGTEDAPTYTEIAFDDFDIPIERNYSLYAKYSGEAIMMARVNSPAFWQSAYRTNITNILFTDKESDVPEENDRIQTWNVRADENCADVTAYLEDDRTGNSTYSLVIYSPHTIYSNYDSYAYFSNFTKLSSITFDNYNTSKVTNMRAMFYNCSGLTNLNVSGFDTSKVTSMHNMFYNCSSLTELDVSGFDTRNVKRMGLMFKKCSGLNELDVSNFDTSKVITMNSMFESCTKLTKLDLSGFNTSKVTTMYNMFWGCSALEELDVSNFDTRNVTTMYRMFFQCTKLKEADLSSFYTPKLTNMNSMFIECKALSTVDMSNFDTSNVTDMVSLFYNCPQLVTVYAGDKWTTEKYTSNTDYLFRYTTKLVGGNGTRFSTSHTNKEYARIDTPETPGYFTRKTATP